jgi:hypothetical protein
VIAISVSFLKAERMRRAFLRRFGKCPQASRRDQGVSPPLEVVGQEGLASDSDQAPKVHRLASTQSIDLDDCAAGPSRAC